MLTKLDSLVAWTQIFSEIKGRVNSYEYDEGGIPAEVYIRSSKRKKDFLTQDEQYQVYLIFLKYEQWKYECRAYDQQDVVNHILK